MQKLCNTGIGSLTMVASKEIISMRQKTFVSLSNDSFREKLDVHNSLIPSYIEDSGCSSNNCILILNAIDMNCTLNQHVTDWDRPTEPTEQN